MITAVVQGEDTVTVVVTGNVTKANRGRVTKLTFGTEQAYGVWEALTQLFTQDQEQQQHQEGST